MCTLADVVGFADPASELVVKLRQIRDPEGVNVQPFRVRRNIGDACIFADYSLDVEVSSESASVRPCSCEPSTFPLNGDHAFRDCVGEGSARLNQSDELVVERYGAVGLTFKVIVNRPCLLVHGAERSRRKRHFAEHIPAYQHATQDADEKIADALSDRVEPRRSELLTSCLQAGAGHGVEKSSPCSRSRCHPVGCDRARWCCCTRCCTQNSGRRPAPSSMARGPVPRGPSPTCGSQAAPPRAPHNRGGPAHALCRTAQKPLESRYLPRHESPERMV